MELQEDEQEFISIYQLDECISWIEINDFQSIVLQFPQDELSNSAKIVLFLQRKTKRQFYVTVSSMCCIDYQSIQHLGNSVIHAIIHFGQVCLATCSLSQSVPVLFVFRKQYDNKLLEYLQKIIEDNITSKKILFLCRTNQIPFVSKLYQKYQQQNDKITFGKYLIQCSKWHFTSQSNNLIIDSESAKEFHKLGPFAVEHELLNFDLVVHLGIGNSLNLRFSFDEILEIDTNTMKSDLISRNKELRKRISKIEKFKNNENEKVGIIFTNPLPDVDEYFSQAKQLAKRCGKKVYFISIVQTLDMFKLGNFTQDLHSFVIVNSCYCSSVLESFDFFAPILSWTEFQIACLVQINYGGVIWNEDVDQEYFDDSKNDSEPKNANQQIIKANIFHPNASWYGLEVDAGKKEASVIKQGQQGIASGYDNELF